MDLTELLRSHGSKVDAAAVRQVVSATLENPAATPSDLVEALAVTLNPSGARVIVDENGEVDSGLAGKVVTTFVRRGEIRIEGRHVRRTEKFGQA